MIIARSRRETAQSLHAKKHLPDCYRCDGLDDEGGVDMNAAYLENTSLKAPIWCNRCHGLPLSAMRHNVQTVPMGSAMIESHRTAITYTSR
jgi:hypothetical protein